MAFIIVCAYEKEIAYACIHLCLHKICVHVYLYAKYMDVFMYLFLLYTICTLASINHALIYVYIFIYMFSKGFHNI